MFFVSCRNFPFCSYVFCNMANIQTNRHRQTHRQTDRDEGTARWRPDVQTNRQIYRQTDKPTGLKTLPSPFAGKYWKIWGIGWIDAKAISFVRVYLCSGALNQLLLCNFLVTKCLITIYKYMANNYAIKRAWLSSHTHSSCYAVDKPCTFHRPQNKVTFSITTITFWINTNQVITFFVKRTATPGVSIVSNVIKAYRNQSYDIFIQLAVPTINPQTPSNVLILILWSSSY